MFTNDEIIQKLKKSAMFGQFSELELKDLIKESEIIELPADHVLFSYLDLPTYIYGLIDGRMDVFSSDTLEKKVAVMRSGEITGGMGALINEPYGLTVKTYYPSLLLKIPNAVFFKFFTTNPAILLPLAQAMSKRLRYAITELRETHYLFKNLALYVMTPEVPLEKIKEQWQLDAEHDNVHLYDQHHFDTLNIDISRFFSQCENNLGVNIFLIRSDDDASWKQAILRHVEYIYLLVDEHQKINTDILSDIKHRPCDIVIYHTQEAFHYNDTHQFYTQYIFKRHHHLTHQKKDYQRLYRYMTGQAIGLVMSGGGFRGYAHYGMVKAIFESGIPIDCIGGSSMGAAIGALLAIKFDWEYFAQAFEMAMKKLTGKRLFRFTLPIFSLLSGEMTAHILKEMYGNYQIENLPINYFCVVSNLSKRQKELKFTGELWEWLKASTAIPGIFPPLEKNGSIYVDGAVCTNLPVQDMREYLDGAGKIITLDVRLPFLSQEKYACPHSLNFFEAVAYKLKLTRKKYIFPSLMDILQESSSINQYIYDMQGSKQADIAIAPDTSSLSFLNPKKGNPLNLLAYQLATEKLQEKRALYERWIEK